MAYDMRKGVHSGGGIAKIPGCAVILFSTFDFCLDLGPWTLDLAHFAAARSSAEGFSNIIALLSTEI